VSTYDGSDLKIGSIKRAVLDNVFRTPYSITKIIAGYKIQGFLSVGGIFCPCFSDIGSVHRGNSTDNTSDNSAYHITEARNYATGSSTGSRSLGSAFNC